MQNDDDDSTQGFQTRAEAERAALARPARDNRPRYVCKDNNGTWHITTHPEYFKDAHRVMPPTL